MKIIRRLALIGVGAVVGLIAAFFFIGYFFLSERPSKRLAQTAEQGQTTKPIFKQENDGFEYEPGEPKPGEDLLQYHFLAGGERYFGNYSTTGQLDTSRVQVYYLPDDPAVNELNALARLNKINTHKPQTSDLVTGMILGAISMLLMGLGGAGILLRIGVLQRKKNGEPDLVASVKTKMRAKNSTGKTVEDYLPPDV